MDERALKRLLIVVAVSIIAIFAFKAMMSRTIVNLGKAAADKKQAAIKTPAVQQEASPADEDTNAGEPSAASAVAEGATLESPSAY